MSVDLIALYLKLYKQCQESSDGTYECDPARFYRDTGFTTYNVLSPLIKNGTIAVRAVGKEWPDSLYQIRMLHEVKESEPKEHL